MAKTKVTIVTDWPRNMHNRTTRATNDCPLRTNGANWHHLGIFFNISTTKAEIRLMLLQSTQLLVTSSMHIITRNSAHIHMTYFAQKSCLPTNVWAITAYFPRLFVLFYERSWSVFQKPLDPSNFPKNWVLFLGYWWEWWFWTHLSRILGVCVIGCNGIEEEKQTNLRRKMKSIFSTCKGQTIKWKALMLPISQIFDMETKIFF